ncbi:Hypothetical protein PHPALM_13373 [Phytophthora palmivora]|uniref:Uncharacterized protein n=1 Tax=Phytophthora palmivora TaxID=4796 RepID=A0A2P4XXF2_9STRA|nr:Hypothetical protein PHPALM_13373 [Phytophthora palmivora]
MKKRMLILDQGNQRQDGPPTDLEEKPLPPPQVPSGTPADRDASRDLQDESPPAKAIQTLVSKSSTKKKSARSKPLRKKLKAPGSDADEQDDLKTVWTDESLETAYQKKELHTFLIKNPVMQIIKPKNISDLKGPVQKPTARSSKLEAAKALLHLIKEGGITAGSFDANDLFDTRLSTINTALMSTFDLLKPLVDEKNTGRSSHYESATEEVDTDSADDPPRMTLGPSGAAMLRKRGDHETKRMTNTIAPNTTQRSNAKLESYFQAAMNRLLKEQQGTSNPAQHQQKIEMWIWSLWDRQINTQTFMNMTQMISTLIPQTCGRSISFSYDHRKIDECPTYTSFRHV